MKKIDLIGEIKQLAAPKTKISVEEVRRLISLSSLLFCDLMLKAGHDRRQLLRMTTKFRDAGRRSAPWKPASSKVPGRPQDGKDGNRISRWLLEVGHKFYADEITATLVEIKYYLQALSMKNAPALPSDSIQDIFTPWLIEHRIEPGAYLDPIQLIPIDLNEVIKEPRSIQSGHFVPLDRDGLHEPKNTFLMLARSNQIQGNLTLDELIKLMEEITAKHREKKPEIKQKAARLERSPRPSNYESPPA